MAWFRLTQLDEGRALKLLETVGEPYAFYLAAKEVHAVIARKDPERAYIAASGYVPLDKEQKEKQWLVKDIMREVGASWFRAEGTTTLKRLPTLSHPELMATPVFQGCVREATTAEQKIALLDRFAGDEKPVIEDDDFKKPSPYLELLRAAASADLPQTRAWFEKRYPAGRKRIGSGARDWHIVKARRALFGAWSATDATAAANWLIAQQHPDEDSDSEWDMGAAARAIAGTDFDDLPVALAWLAKQAREKDRIAALASFLDDMCEDATTRHARNILAPWLASRPLAEREEVVIKVAKEEFVHLQDKGSFLAVVFPDPVKRSELVAQLEKITGPATDNELPYSNTFLLRVFDLPARDKKFTPADSAVSRSRELAKLHELARTSRDPVQRLKGLQALKWMKSSGPAEIEPVLLAHLADNDMAEFGEDLLSAWVLRDWRSCESFATNAPFSVEKRDDMLIHIFCEAAELFPYDALTRMRELIESKVLVQAALNRSATFSAPWWPIYYGDMITRSLARGLVRQGDLKALQMIQTLPLNWQPAALEVLIEHFTTREGGKALLSHFETQNKLTPVTKEEQGALRHGFKWHIWLQLREVLRHLTAISPDDAVKWLEADPRRLSDPFDDYDGGIRTVYSTWKWEDKPAADAWLERVRRTHPSQPKKPPMPIDSGGKQLLPPP